MPSKEQVAPSVRRHVATVITIVILAAIAPAQTSTFTGQFAPFSPPTTFNFDQVEYAQAVKTAFAAIGAGAGAK